MEDQKFISFIIPVLNGETTIGKCLECIRGLEYPKDKFEIIVCDNGSKDRTIEIAKRYTMNILIDNTGTVAKLRNMGAKRAKGDYFAFVDSDCDIPKDWLRIVIPYFNDKEIGMVGAKTYNLPEGSPWWKKAWKVHLDRKLHEKEVMWLPSESIVVRREVFFGVNGFNESLKTCEDVDFGYNIRKSSRIVSDEKLAPIHNEKSKTLYDFFKKEVWRSRGNITVAFKNLDKPQEVLTVLYVLYYCSLLLIFIPACVGSAMSHNLSPIVRVLLGMAIPLAIVSLDTCRRTGKYSFFGSLFIVYAVYILAKIRALFK